MAKQDNIALLRDEEVPKAIVKLATPTVAACLVSIIYSLSDTFFVGLLNDPSQTAAVTLCSTVTLAFFAVTNLFGVGSSSMMSRALGCGDLKTMRESSSFGFWCTLFCGGVFSLLCGMFMEPLMRLLGTDSVTWAPTAAYMRWAVICGAVPSMLNIVLAYLIRSEGATLQASMGAMSGCLLNILLDPVFILPWGLNMGAEGAALATMLSNCVACGFFFVYLFVKRGKTNVCISPKAFTLRREVVSGVCTVGVPASIQNLLNVATHTLLNNMAAPFGAEALAAMGIVAKVTSVPFYVSQGISQGAMPLVGYCWAARLKKRLKDAMRFTTLLSSSVLAVMALLLCLFARQVMQLFIADEATVAYGAVFMIGQAIAIAFLGVDFVAVGIFQAVGYGHRTLLMAFVRKLVLEIPALFLLNHWFPLYGLPFAQTVSEVCMSLLGLWLMILLVRDLDRKPEATEA